MKIFYYGAVPDKQMNKRTDNAIVSPEFCNSNSVIKTNTDQRRSTLGWGQILECLYFTYFPIDWMLRSFKCIEISLADQTQGAETLSKICVWTNENSAGSVIRSHWSRHNL